MRERRALRFVVEALFLAALAAALIVADLSAPAIAGLMLLGWLVVALYEWAATRELPHYGRGLPPRYYVPQVSLPPPRPLEQLQAGYPAAEPLDEEPTWIASPAMRDEMLAEWPVAAGVPSSPVEETVVDEQLFAAIAEELGKEARPEAGAVPEAPAQVEPEPAASLEPDPEAAAEPEAIVEPEPTAAAEPVPKRRSGRSAAAVTASQPEPEPEPELVPEQEPRAATDLEREPASAVVPAPADGPAEAVPGESAAPRLDRHTFDPLGQDEPRRRWRRRVEEDGNVAEVPARPPKPLGLPGHARREQ